MRTASAGRDSASRYTATHLDDTTLRQEASAFAVGERAQLVQFLVRVAEIDARKLYLGAGFACVLEFCVEEYRLTEDEALKRIQAARAARAFPVLFEVLDQGQVCLSRIRMLAPQVTPENVTELVEAAKRHRRLSEFRQFLDRFTKPDLLMTPPAANSKAEETFRALPTANGSLDEGTHLHARGHVSGFPAPNHPPAEPLPDVPEWVEIRVKVPRDKWERLRNVLSHSVPSGDASKIVVRMIDATIEKEEKRKFAACKKPRPSQPSAFRRQRTIPAHVRRAVLERDGGQCTFVSETGRRCTSKRLIEFDHVEPVARGGKPSVENLRLRCRGHNQYEAEQAFGAEFMERKREQARQARAERKPESGTAVADAPAQGQGFRGDVIAGLRTLGVSSSEARLIVERSGALQQATLEESI